MIPTLEKLPPLLDTGMKEDIIRDAVADSTKLWDEVLQEMTDFYKATQYNKSEEIEVLHRYMSYLNHEGNREAFNVDYYVKKDVPASGEHKWQIVVAHNRLVRYIQHTMILMQLLEAKEV